MPQRERSGPLQATAGTALGGAVRCAAVRACIVGCVAGVVIEHREVVVWQCAGSRSRRVRRLPLSAAVVCGGGTRISGAANDSAALRAEVRVEADAVGAQARSQAHRPASAGAPRGAGGAVRLVHDALHGPELRGAGHGGRLRAAPAEEAVEKPVEIAIEKAIERKDIERDIEKDIEKAIEETIDVSF